MNSEIFKHDMWEFLFQNDRVYRDWHGHYTTTATHAENWSKHRVYRTIVNGYACHYFAFDGDAFYVYYDFPRNRVDMLHDLVYNAGMTCRQAFEYIAL